MNRKLLDSDYRSIDRLKSIFEAADFECEVDEDGDLRIIDDVVVLLLSRGNHLLKFVSMFQLTDEADEYRGRELESRVNESVPCIKALLSIEFRILSISWFVNSEGGITTENLVSTFRKFQKFVRMVELFDDDDLLE
jgi:hypothetical protein